MELDIKIDAIALGKAVLESAQVAGYNADSPTMAEKASSVHSFLSTLYVAAIGGKS